MGRELALDLADGSFAPDTISHTPGVSHVTADSLSRRFQPNSTGPWELPEILRGVPEEVVPARGASFWRTAGKCE